jgi:hypothetical protein
MRAGRFALTLLLAPPLAAAEPAAADFGPGLQRLAALGLPEMKDASWVRAPKDDPDSFARSYEFRELGVKLQGGAWKLAGDPPRRVGFATGSPLAEEEAPAAEPAPQAPAEPGILGKMLRKHAASQPKKTPAAKPGPTLDDDVKALLDALAKPDTVEELAEQAEYGRTELPGRLLIFAAQLHAAGHPESANRLATALFAAIPAKTVVIDAAVDHFAKTEFTRVSEAFFNDHDWKNYQAGLQALLAKYPRGWADRPAVALLLPALEKRVAGEKPATPGLPGVTLKPEALAALDQLLAVPAGGGQDDEAFAKSQGVYLSQFPASQRAMILAQLRAQSGGGSFDPGLWLLPGDPPEGPDGPLQQLTAMGMDGLLALAAVATDETLTHSRNLRDGSSYFSSHESAEAIAARRFRELDRPKSRGEIARALLAATLPLGEDDSGQEPDGTLLRDSALEFWKNHGTKSPVELALVFMAEGNDEQRAAAASHLVESDDPAAHAAFEKTVLAADDPVAFASDVENYLDARKTAAKPFLAAYSKLLRATLDGVDLEKMDHSTGSYTVRQAGNIDTYLKKLAVKVGDVSLKEMAREALKADLAPGARRFHALGDAFQSAPVAELLDLVAEIAPDADPAGKLELYQVLVWRAYREDDSESAPMKIEAALASNWRKLLDDAAPLGASDSSAEWFGRFGCTTLGHAAAMALELAADASASGSLRSLIQILDDPAQVAPLLARRATARLDGTEIPALPDAAKVPADRLREITDKVAALPGPEVPPFIRALNLDERAAWAAHLEKLLAEDEPALPASLLDLRNLVTRSGGPDHDAALLEKTGIRDGFRVTPESLTTLATALLAKPDDFSGMTVQLDAAPLGLGLATRARLRGPKSPPTRMHGFLANRFQQAPAETDAMLVIYFDQDDPFGLSLWSSTKGRTNRETVDDGPPDALDQLTEHLASTSHLPFTLEISLLTRADAEKLSNR